VTIHATSTKYSQQHNIDVKPALNTICLMDDQGRKRASAEDGGPPEKRMKGEPEDTEVYSQRIKKKLQANSRTGQACDRCKVRNPVHLVSNLP
jgi:hypothetical protein